MPIAFTQAGVFGGVQGAGNVLSNPTSLQFGPDGRLYVSEQNGSINAFEVELQNGAWVATAHEQLEDANGDEIVKNIQNHDDFGGEIGNGNRQVTGIVVAGTEEIPVIYVSSSNPNIASNGESNQVDTNSGVLTQATWDPAANGGAGAWDVVDLVRGLPRSEENHAVNGMLLSEDGTKLLLQVGGFTNNGGPSNFFSYTNEYALSGTVLEIDLVAVNALQTQTDPQAGQNDTPRDFKYDLPTLDDPNIANDGVREDANGMDTAGPWGGNDGLNMAILPADAPLRIFADGNRNAYDLARGPDGKIYSVDNGSNGGLGGVPSTEGVGVDLDGDGITNEAIGTPNSNTFGEGEPLIQIVEGGYYYHGNPVRSNQNQSWQVYNNSGQPDTNVAVNFVEDISARVPVGVNIAEGFLIDPSKFAGLEGLDPADPADRAIIDARLFLSGVTIDSDDLEQNDPDGTGPGQQVIEVLGSSTNGIMVYDSGGAAFNGAIDGKIFVTQFNDNITLLNVNDAGTALEPVFEEGPDGIFGTADDVLQDPDGVLFVANNSLGVQLSNPLDVVQGPGGTLWTAEIGGNEVTVLAPSVIIDPTSDDSDADGILNVDDPFIRDATNGTSVIIDGNSVTTWEFEQGANDTTPGPDGFGGGLTGAMINGTTDFEEFLQSESTRPQQNIQLDNVKFVTAAAGGTTTVEEVTNGDPFQSGNDGEFFFHTGFQLAETVETFTVKWTVFNPNAGDNGLDITNNFQQIGGYIGDGSQSNYLKIVAIATNNPSAGTPPDANIQIALENGDTVGQTVNLNANGIFDPATLAQDSRIVFELEIDPAAATAIPKATYTTTSGDVEITGGAGDVIDLSNSAVLDTILGNASVGGQPTGIAAGLFATNNGSNTDTFAAAFDSIEVTATEALVDPVAGDDTFGARPDQAILIPVAQLLANDSDANAGDMLTVTAVDNAINGTADLNNGVVTFTPDSGYLGEASFEYTLSDGNGGSDTGLVTVDVSELAVLFRLNASGGTIAALPNDPYGSTLDWEDAGGAGAQSGTQSGFDWSVTNTNTSTHNISGRDASVPDYVPQEIYAVERWDPAAAPDMQWSFGSGDLPNGTYTVNILAGNGFAGTSEPGTRVFDINIEGDLAFDNVDLSDQFGSQVGGFFSYEVQVTDGTLNVELGRDGTDSVENPTINGIEILQGAVAPQSPTIDIVSGDQTVSEGDGTIQVSIITSETVPAGGGDLAFTYVITGVSAVEGSDYELDETLNGSSSGSVFTGNATIAAGSSDFQIPIDILQDMDPEGTETFTVEIVSVGPGYDIGNGTATITIQDDDTVTAPGEAIYRINSGGPAVLATDGGIDWEADQNPNPVSYLVAGGPNTFAFNVAEIVYDAGAVNGAPEAIFQNERWDPPEAPDPEIEMQYEFAVDPGTYTINLYMVEGSQAESSPGERIFDVAVEGVVPGPFDDIEPYALGGSGNGNTGSAAQNGVFVLSHTQEITDGTLDLDFLHDVIQNPAIRGIEIVAVGDPDAPAVVSIGAPDPASVVEGGDTGVTTLEFPVTFDVPPTEAVTVAYDVDVNGTVTSGTLMLGTADGVIAVGVPNDDADDGGESVTVTLTAITAGDAAAELGTAVSASGTVTEDDVTGPVAGDVLYRVNVGGPAEIVGADDSTNPGDPDLDWGGDTGNFGTAGNSPYLAANSSGGSTYNSSAGSSHAGDASFDDPSIPAGTPGAIFQTERFDQGTAPEMLWQFPVQADFGLQPGDQVIVRLYFAELFGNITGAGQRSFDVSVEGVVPVALDDVDPFATAGANAGFMLDTVATIDADGVLDIEFLHDMAENPAVKGIEILAADDTGGYMPPLDDLFGTAVELSDSGLAPTDAGLLSDGDNIMSATQEGESGTNAVRDRDYFTVNVPDGKILTGIFLDSYDISNQASSDGFFAFQEGAQVTTDPVTGANVDALTGAIIYGDSDVGTNLLETMRAGFNDPASGNSLPAFDQKLTGDLAFWLNQGAGPNTPTLRFVVEDDPDAGVPGAYLPNNDGNFVFEAEDGYNGEGQWDLKTTGDLPPGHEAPSGGEYLEANSNDLGSPNGSDVLTYQFVPEEDGFIRINLITSRNPGDNATEHNDSWVGIQQDGVTIAAVPQQGVELEPLGALGLYKAFSSGGDGDTFDNIANKNIDNVGKAIVMPVEAGVVYDFLLANRSAGHEVDKVVLEFGTTAFTSPNSSAAFHDGQELSPQIAIEPVGEAVLTINDTSNNIEVSNFGNNSFVITNTGDKDITSIEIDVTDALLPDAVFDPFAQAGDLTAKPITIGNEGGTGILGATGTNNNGQLIFGEAAIGINYIGVGGVSGFEKIVLNFDDFNPGESISFGADMDPNSIAGAPKGTLDDGAFLAGATGGASEWDIGGISGAELTNSTFTVTYADATSSLGELQGRGTGQQSGGKALSSQASEGLAVALTVNGLGEGSEGTYDSDGPVVTVQGPAGEFARVVLAKGFIVPFTNEFTNGTPAEQAYAPTLDAQLAALAASGFPANNFVELQYFDVLLDGTVQDITSEFDFTDVDAYDLSVPDQINEFGVLEEDKLPLGFAASVIDTASDESKGPVTDPIHLVYSDVPVADLSLDKTVSDINPDFGDQVVFTVSVTNDGPDTATGIAVEDLLSSGFAFVQAEGSVGSYDDTTGLWTVDSLASGATETLVITATVLEGGTPEPDEVLYRVNAGGAEVAAEDGGIPWSEDTQGTNSPFLVNAGSNSDFPTNGSPNLSVDVTEVNAPAGVIGIERWDNTNDAAGEMAWAFDVAAGTEVQINLYFAELFTGIPDANGDQEPTGDRIFDVSVDGVIPATFADIDQYTLAGEQFAKGVMLSTTVISDGTIDLEFLHKDPKIENTAIKGIEIIELGAAGGLLDYTNGAQIVASDVFDPDSTPGNASGTEDDEASITLAPIAGGINLVTIAAAANAAEPDTDGQFIVSLEDVADTDTTVNYTVGGTATAGTDYEALTGEVIIAAGATSAPIDLTVLDDDDLDPGETVELTLTGATGDANLQLGSETVATASIADDELPPVNGSAVLEITPGGGLGATTFGGSDKIQIMNTGVIGDANIAQITLDFSTGILPDMVWDPTGSGGDATAQIFTAGPTAAAVGLVAPGNPGPAAGADDADPFSQPRNGGWDRVTLNFTDFNPGETFTFTSDVDPNSIQDVPGAGNAGAVSGYELIGSTVTITFDDGTQQQVATSSLFQDGSLGGSVGLGETVLSTSTVLGAPVISLVGPAQDASTGLAGDQVYVPDGETAQTVRVTGTPGATVTLLQMDARLYIASGDDPFDVAPDEAPFYANEATAGKVLYSGVLDGTGEALIPVDLLETPIGTGPDGGLNHFVAVLSEGAYVPGTAVSQTSNTLVVTQAPTVDLAIAPVTDGAEPGTDAQFEVTLGEVSAVDTVVAYTVAGTATAGTDYTALSGQVTVAAGATSAVIDVEVLDDLDDDDNETVSVTLTEVLQSDGRASIGASDAASVSILDDDASNTAPTITSGDSFEFAEGVEDPVFTATAVDAQGDTIIFSLGGADAASFVVNPGTGAVSFDDTPVFVDGGDNLFEFDLIAFDGALFSTQAVTVEVLKDSDEDTIADRYDNATLVANTDQRDTDGDGYGNVIDLDLDNDWVPGGNPLDRAIDFEDFLAFSFAYGSAVPQDDLGPIADADFDGNGTVGFEDFLTFAGGFGEDMGPAAVDFDLIT